MRRILLGKRFHHSPDFKAGISILPRFVPLIDIMDLYFIAKAAFVALQLFLKKSK